MVGARDQGAKQLFDLFGAAGGAQYTVWSLAGIFLTSIVQNGGLSHSMGICGSAKNEFAAMGGDPVQPDALRRHEAAALANWEFCKWDKVDAIGFIACCTLSATIVGIFLALLKWAAP